MNSISEVIGKFITTLKEKLPNASEFEGNVREYILTQQEEQAVLSNEMDKHLKILRNDLSRRGFSQKTIQEEVDKISIEDIADKNEILRKANERKHWKLEDEEYEKRKIETELKRQQEINDRWSANYFYGYLKYVSKKIYKKDLIFLKEDFTEKIITAYCYFLSRDKRFETDLGMSFEKGLVVRGSCGLGKTFIPKCLANNERNPICIISMLEVAESVRETGEYKINMGSAKILYFDDVGTEESTISYYGTKINWFKNFIEMYYLNNGDFSNIIISTNCSFAQLKEEYSFRVEERLREKMNVLHVEGESLRRKKN